MSTAKMNSGLYIPHVFPNFGEEYIKKVFEPFGKVSEIDFVAKQDRNGKEYNSVYIHFKIKSATPKADAFWEKVADKSKECRVYHDRPWFWIVLPNTAKKYISGDRKQRIDIGEVANALSSTVDATLCTDKPIAVQSLSFGYLEKRINADAIVMKGEPCFLRQQQQATAHAIKSYADAAKHKTPFEEEKQVFDADTRAQLDEIEEEMKKDDEMDEMDEEMKRDDEHLRYVDIRYVNVIEMENTFMMTAINTLQADNAELVNRLNQIEMEQNQEVASLASRLRWEQERVEKTYQDMLSLDMHVEERYNTLNANLRKAVMDGCPEQDVLNMIQNEMAEWKYRKSLWFHTSEEDTHDSHDE